VWANKALADAEQFGLSRLNGAAGQRGSAEIELCSNSIFDTYSAGRVFHLVEIKNLEPSFAFLVTY